MNQDFDSMEETFDLTELDKGKIFVGFYCLLAKKKLSGDSYEIRSIKKFLSD
jgi:hypothetical protein